jgi:methylthioribose-1-phosphate isomerase
MSGVPHAEPISGASYSAVELLPEGDAVVMLDQRELPEREQYVELRSVEEVARAIRDMVVRGAPAIGISAAYGMVLAARAHAKLDEAARLLKAARPTAVNLSWAVDRMSAVAAGGPHTELPAILAAEARAIHREDVAACRAMGRIGAERIPDGAAILTHCNAGALATGGFGTALGVIRAAAESGKRLRVYADETRPYLQGARLTAWELAKSGISVDVLVDGAAGYLFSRGEVSLAVVGADRIAANGDVANKIGTYAVACLASMHERPFYVAAPWSTVDLSCQAGTDIVIEERAALEVTHLGARRVVPEGISVLNPAFDVTPARLVSAIFTDRGAVEPVSSGSLASLAKGP